MLRRATTAGTVAASTAALLLGLTACNAGFAGDDTTGGGAPANGGQSEPGRHSVLPEPCAAPDADLLAEVLPDAEPRVLDGRRQTTHDSGRRFACDWRHQDGDSTYALTVDFLRVISYDPEVGDDAQTARDLLERAEEAGVSLDPEDGGTASPDGSDSSGSSGSPDASEGTDTEDGPGDDEEESGDPDGGPQSGGASSTPEDDDLAPRPLDELGSAAFVDDRLSSDGTRRTISVVFHSSNVIVAIDYTKTVADPGAVNRPGADATDTPAPPDDDPSGETAETDEQPDGSGEVSDPLDSATVQEQTIRLARQLAGLFED